MLRSFLFICAREVVEVSPPTLGAARVVLGSPVLHGGHLHKTIVPCGEAQERRTAIRFSMEWGEAGCLTGGYCIQSMNKYQMTKNLSYPVDWPIIARAIKEAANYRCQACDRQCRRPGEFYLGWEYELTVAHYWHEYDTPAAFVVALCSRCHLLHDAPFAWPARRRADRLRQTLAGQLSLLAQNIG